MIFQKTYQPFLTNTSFLLNYKVRTSLGFLYFKHFILYLPLVILANLPVISCNYTRSEGTQYSIYASVLDSKFGHLSAYKSAIVGIGNTIYDSRDELSTLIYSVKNNDQFFAEYCQGDSSFKDFILSTRIPDEGKNIINLEKLRTRTKVAIDLRNSIKHKPHHHTIIFSNITLNRSKNKGILFIMGSSSGSWVFVELVNEKWTVRHEILSWII